MLNKSNGPPGGDAPQIRLFDIGLADPETAVRSVAAGWIKWVESRLAGFDEQPALAASRSSPKNNAKRALACRAAPGIAVRLFHAIDYS